MKKNNMKRYDKKKTEGERKKIVHIKLSHIEKFSSIVVYQKLKKENKW